MQALLSYKKGDQSIDVDRAGVEAFVAQIAKSVDQQAKDAGITVDDNGKLTALPGQTGISVDQAATTDAVVRGTPGLARMTVELVYPRRIPAISDDVASAAAEKGETLLNQGVKVTWDGGSITLDRGDLLKALTVRIRDVQDDPFVFGFDSHYLRAGAGADVQEPQGAGQGAASAACGWQDRTGAKGRERQRSRRRQHRWPPSSTQLRTARASAKLTVKTTEPTLSMPVISQILSRRRPGGIVDLLWRLK